VPRFVLAHSLSLVKTFHVLAGPGPVDAGEAGTCCNNCVPRRELNVSMPLVRLPVFLPDPDYECLSRLSNENYRKSYVCAGVNHGLGRARTNQSAGRAVSVCANRIGGDDFGQRVPGASCVRAGDGLSQTIIEKCGSARVAVSGRARDFIILGLCFPPVLALLPATGELSPVVSLPRCATRLGCDCFFAPVRAAFLCPSQGRHRTRHAEHAGAGFPAFADCAAAASPLPSRCGNRALAASNVARADLIAAP